MTSANQPPRPISPPQAAPRPTPSVRQPLFTPMQPARAPRAATAVAAATTLCITDIRLLLNPKFG